MTRRMPSERTARGNRAGIATAGALLVAAGTAALAASPGAAILPAGAARIGAWWWAVAAGAAALALCCLRWLAVQARRDTFGSFLLETDGRSGITRVPTAVLERVAEAELAGVPGVARASVRFAGWATAPELRVVLGLEEGASVAAARAALDGDVVPDLCTALEIGGLPSHLTLRLDVSRPRREATRLPDVPSA